MVASLQNKKEALEAKLKDKTSELRKLCIEEAELTGFLPPETPIEPGESPPVFRRRIGTAFTYPESLINKLKCKEDEASATLELECKIQNGIAEAALGLANDGTASKSVRRKHRVLYEESQRRLSELESRLIILKQSQPKHKKKPRPHAESEGSAEGEAEEVSDLFRQPTHPILTASLSDRSGNSMRHSHTYGGLIKPETIIGYHQRMVQSHMHLPSYDYRTLDYHEHVGRSNNPSPIDPPGAWWSKGRETWYSSSIPQPTYINNSPVEHAINYDRFRSLDRNALSAQNIEPENRVSATLPRNAYIPHSNTLVLLPSQTYPENSLMRTQSLGNMDTSKQLNADRKIKEKEWYESNLDSHPVRTSQQQIAEDVNAIKISEEKCLTLQAPSPKPPSEPESNQACISSIQFDTVVPYESPKNHTVVQAGKWQPYREVTKPFEMSDFYKYSTKFKQSKVPVQPQKSQDQNIQHKGVYKPPQPLECQPVSVHSSEMQNPTISESYPAPPPPPPGWYHKKSLPKPRSSTLV